MNLGQIKDLSIIVTGIITLLGLFSGVWEYARRQRQERARYFVELRRHFLENESFRRTLTLLSDDSPELATTSIQDRRDLGGFLEEVGLMVNSGLIRREVAHYMFGRYFAQIADSKYFWVGMDPDEDYWRVFRQSKIDIVDTFRHRGGDDIRL